MYNTNNDSPWTENKIARLRELVKEGFSTSEIGRLLGMSKNAVVGKCHHLDLPARPSPIIRDRRPKPPRIPRMRSRPTLPALRCLQQPALTRAPATADRPLIAQPPTPALQPAVSRPVSRPWQKSQECCWPIGHPGTPGFRFCEAESVPGKPYCAEQTQLAHVKVRNRRDDTA